jgi:hypothetical protein
MATQGSAKLHVPVKSKMLSLCCVDSYIHKQNMAPVQCTFKLMSYRQPLLKYNSTRSQHRWVFIAILFYSILFYSILFYSILFYSILFYSITKSTYFNNHHLTDVKMFVVLCFKNISPHICGNRDTFPPLRSEYIFSPPTPPYGIWIRTITLFLPSQNHTVMMPVFQQSTTHSERSPIMTYYHLRQKHSKGLLFRPL